MDYIPTGTYETMKIVITVDKVSAGSKWKDTCINEVEVYERVGK